jgi:hypothetical protein
MSVIDRISSSISELSKFGQEEINYTSSIIGTVLSIDGTNTCTIQPVDTKRTPISNILLISDSNSAPTLVPAIGTTVTVTLFSSNSGYIAQHGSVGKVALAPGTNNYGGLIILSDAVARFNNIENLINSFFLLYNSHVHPVTAIGVPTGPTPSLETSTLTITVNSDLENPIVTHGNGVADKVSYLNNLQQAKSQVETTTALLSGVKEQLRNANITLANMTQTENPVAFSTQQAKIADLERQQANITETAKKAQTMLDYLNANPQ